MTDKIINVVSYAGYRGEESPRTFVLEDETIHVLEIVNMWIEEEEKGRGRKRFFKLKGSDGFTHTLYYDLEKMEWFYKKRERDMRDSN